MDQVFSDQRTCLETIGRYIRDNAVEPYADVEIKAALFEDGLISIEAFYRPRRSPQSREPFLIEDAETDFEFAQCFQQLAELVSTPEKGLFKECVYRLDADGKYSANYIY